MDYLFRRLAVDYLTPAERAELNILTTGERTQPTLPGVEEAATETVQGSDVTPDPPSIPSAGQLRAQLELGWRGAGSPETTPPGRSSPSSARVPRSDAPASARPIPRAGDSPFCMSCGIPMQRAGSCFVCTDCGTTSGCS